MAALRLRKIEIQGFRSFGTGRQSVELPDTVSAIWGGNSQGKTSLAEAIEFLVSGQISRRELLASAKDEFADSLRNAHMPSRTPVVVEAEFLCPDGAMRRLRRTLLDDYKGSTTCNSEVEIDGKTCAEEDLERVIGLRRLQAPLRAPVLAQHTLGYVFSASPTERAAYFRAVLDTQDLEDFRAAVAAIAPQIDISTAPELVALSAIDSIPELAASAGNVRASPSQADMERELIANLSVLLTALGLTPRGNLVDDAELLADELERRRKQTFPLALFARKPFNSWSGVAPELGTAIEAFDRERLAVDAETRRLVTLFDAALAVPGIAHAHEALNCPLCGTKSTLTPERIGYIRAQVAANGAYQEAERAVIDRLRALNAGLEALKRNALEALPKFAQLPTAERRAEGFTTSRIHELVADAAVVLAWTKAARSLMRASHVLVRSIQTARHEVGLALSDISQWSSAPLSECLEAVTEAQSGFDVAQHVYAAPSQALFQPFKAAVDQGTKTQGWEEIIDAARNPAALWQALLGASAQELLRTNLEAALKEIDAGNGKVADEKFDELSDAVKLWWERLRPDEPTFFSAVKRRSAKARRTIDLKVGLSAKDDRSDPKFRDAIAIFSQSQLHCLGLSLFLARAIEEETGFIVLDDPVLTSDDDFRPNFASTVIEELLAAGMQVIVLTQDHASWKDIGHRWAFRNAAQFQMIRNDPIIGTEIRNENDALTTMIAKAHPFINSQDAEQRKQGAIQLRQAIERLSKEILVRSRRASGDHLASITNYDGHDFGTYSGQVFALLTQEPSHPGKLKAAHAYVTPGPHDDTPPSKGQLKHVMGELKKMKKDYLD